MGQAKQAVLSQLYSILTSDATLQSYFDDSTVLLYQGWGDPNSEHPYINHQIDGDNPSYGFFDGRYIVDIFDISPKSDTVNAIAFHPVHGTFATGGCDGLVLIWDGQAKKRLAHFKRYPTSIAALDFNASGSLLAVASSYTYERGEIEDQPADKIFIRSIRDAEVRPRKKKRKR